MKSIREKITPFLAGFALALIMFAAVSIPLGQAQTQTASGGIAGPLGTLTPFYTYTSTFTATSQSTTQKIPPLSTAAIEVTGTALTTVTWQITCSPDGGTNFFAIPYTTGAVTATYNLVTVVAGSTPITTTSATMYWVNLAGCNAFKLTTSSTFTATNVSIRVVGSGLKGII